MKNTKRFILILALVILLWDVSIVEPLKIFSQYIHQIGHLIMALGFSYNFGTEISISIAENSYAVVDTKSALSRFMIANAGYLGSILFSFLIFYLKGTHVKKYIMGSVALLFVAISLSYSVAEDMHYTTIFVTVVLLIYIIQNPKFEDWAIDVVGVTAITLSLFDTLVNCVVYYINKELEIITEWSKQIQPYTDTMQLKDITGIPAELWGVLWSAGLIISVYFIFINFSEKEAKPLIEEKKAA